MHSLKAELQVPGGFLSQEEIRGQSGSSKQDALVSSLSTAVPVLHLYTVLGILL